MTKVSLYDLLRVEKTATTVEIRKAFLALAKKVHPDKLKQEGANDDAGEAFRALRKAYDILSDPQKRERYDRTGVSDDESQTFADAYERFRGVKVTEADIERAEAEYRNSDEEKTDLKAFFEDHQGDVTHVLAFIIGSRDQDIPRYVEFWTSELKAGRLSKTFKKKFDTTKNEILKTEELDNAEEDIEMDEEGEDEDDDEEEEEDSEEEEDGDFIASEDDEEPVDEEDEEDLTSEKLVFTPGDAVQVRWKSGKSWYDAFILGVNKKAKTYDVEYTRGKTRESDVPANLVRAKSVKTDAKPNLSDVDPALLAMFQRKAQDRNDAFETFAAKHTKRSKKS